MKHEEKVRRRKEELKKQGKKDKERSFSSITAIEFKRVARKAQEKKKKVASGLLKIKAKVQGVNTFV